MVSNTVRFVTEGNGFQPREINTNVIDISFCEIVARHPLLVPLVQERGQPEHKDEASGKVLVALLHRKEGML